MKTSKNLSWSVTQCATAARRGAPLALALLLGTGAASAQEIPGYPSSVTAYDPREVAMLPSYCPYTQLFRDHVPGGNDQAMINNLTARLGSVFHHMHHYCYGLMKMNRAVLLSRDAMTRQFYLNDAVTEYDYVIQRAKADFVLLPEILTKKGEALVHLRRGPLAVFEFERAIDLKRDYWPAYAWLADYYKDNGQRQKAREVLEDGLKAAPDTKALQRRLRELDSTPAAGLKR